MLCSVFSFEDFLEAHIKDRKFAFLLTAEGVGLPHLSAYLDSVGSNYSHGVNFATAGSTIRPQNTTMAQSGYSPVSLDVQVVQYLDFHKRSQTFRRQGVHWRLTIIVFHLSLFSWQIREIKKLGVRSDCNEVRSACSNGRRNLKMGRVFLTSSPMMSE